MRKSSRKFILLEAFKLFAYKTYEQVTYTELEKATSLSRGALLYHFKSKEDIFIAVCDKYLIEESSILKKLEERTASDISLSEFIKLYIEIIKEIKESSKIIGVKNINKALINITNQASYYYPNFNVIAIKWQVMQVHMWSNVLKYAVKKGELRKDIDVKILADLFEDIYCGISYAGIVYPFGIELKRLETAFAYVYDLIKK